MKEKFMAKSGLAIVVLCLMLGACSPKDPVETSTQDDVLETTTQEMNSSVEETTKTPETPVIEPESNTINTSDWEKYKVVREGDWDQNRGLDQLRVYSEEMEGSEYTIGLELIISGKKPYVSELPWSVSYEDLLMGDFDGDGQQEYGIVFDIHANGANGGCGMLLLDYEEEQWVELTETEPFLFTGFSYEVISDEGGWYHIIGRESGLEHMVQGEEIPETDGGEVTPFWVWAVVEGETQDHIQIWQYAAGGHKINQIGDVVTTFGVKDGQLSIVDEYVSQDLMAYDVFQAEPIGRRHSMVELGGAYYVRHVNPAGMVLECAPEHHTYETLKQYESFFVPFSSWGIDLMSTGIESSIELSVLCFYDEWVQHWDPEQRYYIGFYADGDRLTINRAEQIPSQQNFSRRWSGMFYRVKPQGDQWEIYPVEYVEESDEQRLQELMQQGWNLEEVPYSDMYHFYMFVYDTEKHLVRSAENIRYYAIDAYGIYPISRDELRLKEGEYSGDYRLVIKDGVVECILDHWLP